MDPPGSAFERPEIVGLDPAIATVARNEAFLPRPLACRQAGRTVTFIRFMSLEEFDRCIG